MKNAEIEKKQGTAPCLVELLQTDHETARSSIMDRLSLREIRHQLPHTYKSCAWRMRQFSYCAERITLGRWISDRYRPQIGSCKHLSSCNECDIFRSAFLGSVLKFNDFSYKSFRARGQISYDMHLERQHCKDGLCLMADFGITGIKYTDSTRRVLVIYV
jgi:hypothetical protein